MAEAQESIDHRPFKPTGMLWLKREKPLTAALAILVLAAIVEFSSVPTLLTATLNSYLETLPFILLSIALASSIKASGAESSVARVLSGRGAVLTAAAFGALSPFCSCGVIPLIAGLLAAGAPLAPVMAFWLASPVIDPEMLILTWNILGAELAMAKLAAAIAIGLLGGSTVLFLQARGMMQQPLRESLQISTANSCCSGSSDSSHDQPDTIAWAFWRDADRLETFLRESKALAWFLSKWLLLAFLLEAVMLRWAPMEQLVESLNNMGYASIPLAAMIGVPAYLNGYAAIPLMRGLLDSGLLPGAALSFMVAGGVTCIPAVVGVWGLVRRSTFTIYLSVAALGSVLVGVLFQLLTVG